MAEKKFPVWATTLYRGVRSGVAGGTGAFTAAKFVFGLDLLDPKTLKMAAIVFAFGFLTSFGKWAREWLDEQFGYDEKSVVAKVFPV